MVRRMDRDEAAQFLATFQRLVKKVGDADTPVVAAFVGSLLAELRGAGGAVAQGNPARARRAGDTMVGGRAQRYEIGQDSVTKW